MDKIVINFGKYKGKSVGEVKSSDPKYIEWIINKDLEGDTTYPLGKLQAEINTKAAKKKKKLAKLADDSDDE